MTLCAQVTERLIYFAEVGFKSAIVEGTNGFALRTLKTLFVVAHVCTAHPEVGVRQTDNVGAAPEPKPS